MAHHLSSTKALVVFLATIYMIHSKVFAQENINIDCDSSYFKFEPHVDLFNDYLFANNSKPAEVLEWGTTDISSISESTFCAKMNVRVFVEFIVDTLGIVHCPKVIKSECLDYNLSAIEIIKHSKFKPAEINGKQVISVLTYPVFFKPYGE